MMLTFLITRFQTRWTIVFYFEHIQGASACHLLIFWMTMHIYFNIRTKMYIIICSKMKLYDMISTITLKHIVEVYAIVVFATCAEIWYRPKSHLFLRNAKYVLYSFLDELIFRFDATSFYLSFSPGHWIMCKAHVSG